MADVPFKCPTCDGTTLITKENAIIHLHPAQPEYNFVELTCKCGQTWCVFKVDELFIQLHAAGVGYISHVEPAPLTRKAYLSLYSKDEDIVAYFHRILEDVKEVCDIDWKEHKTDSD